MALVLYLVVTGGNNNTGPLWMYIVAPVCMFLGGFRRGLIANVLFTSIVAVILFIPDNALLTTSYTYEFKTRLLYSYATVIFLSVFYEYSREQSFASLGRLRDQFERQAFHDQLTRLPNRRNLNEQLKHEYQRKTMEVSFSIGSQHLHYFCCPLCISKEDFHSLEAFGANVVVYCI